MTNTDPTTRPPGARKKTKMDEKFFDDFQGLVELAKYRHKHGFVLQNDEILLIVIADIRSHVLQTAAMVEARYRDEYEKPVPENKRHLYADNPPHEEKKNNAKI